MSIPFKTYVLIRSGVGGAAIVPERELIGRIFTTNPLVPVDAVVEFTSAGDVATYFGVNSPEAQRAAFYFSYIDPNVGTPLKLSFGRWVNAAQPPIVFGVQNVQSVAVFQLVTAGVLAINVDGVTVNVTGIDLSAAANPTDVASAIQTAVRAQAGGNAQLTTAVISYDAVAARYIFTGAQTGPSDITFTPGVGSNDLVTLLGWDEVNGISSPGANIQTPAGALTASDDVSDNFGGFVFIATLTQAQVVELAQVNAGFNIKYMYSQGVMQADALNLSAALISTPSVGLTLQTANVGEFPELIPLMQMAATNYGQRNSVVNYMFRQFSNVTPSVRDGNLAAMMDAARVNYYGETQTAGRKLAFYQRGILMGPASAPTDMNVHANEQWLKSAVGAALMNLLLAAGRVPANDTGRRQVLAVIQESIDDALFNGVISVGKNLTPQQIAFITQQTGDPRAHYQVQTAGYWIDCVIEEYVNNNTGITEYKAVYKLIYSKDDAIRFIDGTHQLI